ncbi:flagellar protein FlgN [uncultured Erythrobacter sp.]|uniref:flagellar protein FlgN n=1 Tax=uncultured Erythrobacter sp. TaxID=263913 RepID=UPI00261DB143|nr:flagellar protein FlgN [uncultured Erythrobacter sp.]
MGDHTTCGNKQAEHDLHGNLRQMIAVLQAERQALATLEAKSLSAVTREKESLCDVLADIDHFAIDDDARALSETAKSLNEVNRRVRNLLAANVAGRLDALSAERPGRHAYTAESTTP